MLLTHKEDSCLTKIDVVFATPYHYTIYSSPRTNWILKINSRGNSEYAEYITREKLGTPAGPVIMYDSLSIKTERYMLFMTTGYAAFTQGGLILYSEAGGV